MQLNTYHKRFAERPNHEQFREGSLSPSEGEDTETRVHVVPKEVKVKEKSKKRRPVKVYCADSTLEIPLFQYFLTSGEWENGFKYEKSHYIHYTRENNLKWDTESGVLLNKVPGFFFLHRKKEQAYLINIFKETYLGDDFPYFPETFLMIEDHPLYVQVHNANPDRKYMYKMTTGSEKIGKQILSKPSDLKYDNATVNSKICDQVIQRLLDKPLVVDGMKADIRIYLCVASVDPFLVYINREGLVRTVAKESGVPESELGRRTLTSFWESLAKSGKDVAKIQTEIADLVQITMKCFKPFLQYFYKLTFQKEKMEHHFHLLSMDIILDEQCRPWLLELSGSPSLKCTYHFKEGAPKVVPATADDRDRYIEKWLDQPCVDLQVKATAYGDGIRLCLKHIEKVRNISVYDSYTLVFSPEIDEARFGHMFIFDGLYALYSHLHGQVKFTSNLPSSKWQKIGEFLEKAGCKKLSQPDLDLIYRNTMVNFPEFDLYAFIRAVRVMMEKASPGKHFRDNLQKLVVAFLDSSKSKQGSAVKSSGLNSASKSTGKKTNPLPEVKTAEKRLSGTGSTLNVPSAGVKAFTPSKPSPSSTKQGSTQATPQKPSTAASGKNSARAEPKK